ncbi:13822_t:CDS:1 [Racocetra fulgida]|uniref:13822_t:CDS:1 n=1 Tax=Racocetra fulgida TaxID=60492 RepID=A0A9N9K1U3_9GLOM|nr:13822_t:CDS:1 [Racocetra fulgida]
MEPFQVTAPILKLLLRLQKYIKESSIESLCITDSTIEFLDRQGDQVPINLAPEINDDLLETRMPLFIEDLHRIGDPAKELCKVEGTSWNQQMDYLCIRIQLCRLDRATLLQHYYQLGERLAMHNWDEEVKREMKDRFTYRSYKNALRITRRVYSLYYIRGAHNLLTTCHLSANILLEMNIGNFNVLLEEARLGSQREIEQLLALD